MKKEPKGYHEQKYKHSQPLKITLHGGDVFHDEIKGLNKGHALHLAKQNWPAASKIEPTKIAMHHKEREARSQDAHKVKLNKIANHEAEYERAKEKEANDYKNYQVLQEEEKILNK